MVRCLWRRVCPHFGFDFWCFGTRASDYFGTLNLGLSIFFKLWWLTWPIRGQNPGHVTSIDQSEVIFQARAACPPAQTTPGARPAALRPARPCSGQWPNNDNNNNNNNKNNISGRPVAHLASPGPQRQQAQVIRDVMSSSCPSDKFCQAHGHVLVTSIVKLMS